MEGSFQKMLRSLYQKTKNLQHSTQKFFTITLILFSYKELYKQKSHKLRRVLQLHRNARMYVPRIQEMQEVQEAKEKQPAPHQR